MFYFILIFSGLLLFNEIVLLSLKRSTGAEPKIVKSCEEWSPGFWSQRNYNYFIYKLILRIPDQTGFIYSFFKYSITMIVPINEHTNSRTQFYNTSIH